MQASYHLQVQAGGNPLWESGQSIHVPYSGAQLPPHTLCTAQVRVTDTHGLPLCRNHRNRAE